MKQKVKNLQHGFIFKDVTGEEEVPKDCITAWKKVVEAKGFQGKLIETKGESYSEEIIPMRGNVFENDYYSSDIDKHL